MDLLQSKLLSAPFVLGAHPLEKLIKRQGRDLFRVLDTTHNRQRLSFTSPVKTVQLRKVFGKKIVSDPLGPDCVPLLETGSEREQLSKLFDLIVWGCHSKSITPRDQIRDVARILGVMLVSVHPGAHGCFHPLCHTKTTCHPLLIRYRPKGLW